MSVRVATVPSAVERGTNATRRSRALARIARRNRLAVLAALTLLAAVLLALLAPWLPLLDPDTVDTPNRLRPPLTSQGSRRTLASASSILAPQAGEECCCPYNSAS